MHSTTLLFPLLAALAPTSLARITGISLPTTISPNSNIPITLITEDYVQSVQDVAISFGLAPSANAHDGSLGTSFWGSKDIYQSNVLTNITDYVQTPASGFVNGAAVVTASLFSLYGADYEGTVTSFTFDVTVEGA